MTTKIIDSDSFDWGRPSVDVVPVHSRGVDSQWLTKVADDGTPFEVNFGDVQPMKGHTILHVIAVGDHEKFGFNRNGDAFSGKDNDECHSRFKTQGHVFLDHKHKDPSLAVGKVLDTAYNKPMGRIEILLAADNNKAAKYLTKYKDGTDLPVSMGCTVDAERCSVCGHVAPRAKYRCEHVKQQLGETLDDGRAVFMWNPDPQYFDISLVWRPADRIGYSLRKIANDEGLERSDELAEIAGLGKISAVKLAALRKISSIEKTVPGFAKSLPEKLLAPTKSKLLKTAKDVGVAKVLGALHTAGCLLHPEDLFELLGVPGDTSGACQALEEDPGVGKLLNDDDSCESLDGEDSDVDLDDNVRRACGTDPSDVKSRILRITIIKSAGKSVTNVDKGLADFYRHYKVAFAAKNLDNTPRLIAVAATF